MAHGYKWQMYSGHSLSTVKSVFRHLRKDLQKLFYINLHVLPLFLQAAKDVALINMANILHRAHFSADAAILAHAALDLTTDLLTSHYTLGNIYAVSAAF